MPKDYKMFKNLSIFIYIESNGLWLLDNYWLFILNYVGAYTIKLL
jgi:hypothetical protein